MNVEEVAERLTVSVGTVRTLIHEGQLAATRVRRQLRVSEEQLADYLKQAKVVSYEK